MSDNRQLLQQRDDDTQSPTRLTPSRPPIEWPVRQTNIEPDRERATQFARQHVDRLYSQDDPYEEQPESRPVNNERPQQTNNQQPYNWQQYHSAWQQYYHQYFYRYYAGWWAQQKQELESQHQSQIESVAARSNDGIEEGSERDKIAKELRDKIRNTAKERAEKVKKSTHFKPLLAAVSVGAIFLLVNYNQVLVGAVKQYVAPGSVVTTPVIVEPNANAVIGPEPKIIIPKIGVEAPVVYDEPRVDEPSYQAALDRGVVRLGTTADPGTKGNVVIGGHSSNNVFNAGGYKYVFVNLKKLDEGDIFYLNFEGNRYTYKVTVARKIVAPNDTSVLAQTDKPTVTLFTCDPPGTNINRLIVQAEQIDPSPSRATENTNAQTEVNQDNPLPSVAPSLWDRIFGR